MASYRKYKHERKILKRKNRKISYSNVDSIILEINRKRIQRTEKGLI